MNSMLSSVAAPSLTVSDFLPGETDRAVFFGQSGSGKTTLERNLATTSLAGQQWPLVVLYDTKGLREPWNGYVTYTRMRDLPRHANRGERRIIYKPNLEEMPEVNPVAAEIFFKWCYQHKKGMLVICDEVTSVVHGASIPFWLFACLTKGREKGIAVWVGSQRPALVPLVAFSEANCLFTFRLQMDEDRKRVAKMVGMHDSDALSTLPFHNFYYYRTGLEEVEGPYTVTGIE
jgi:hypothetical protein